MKRHIHKIIVLFWALSIIVGVISTGCATRVCGFKEEDLLRWYVPAADASQKEPVPCEQVAFLDAAPTNRAFRVVGLVTPPDGKFRSWAEAINATRAAASLHGADAVYLISEQEYEAWGFSSFGGGSGKRLRIRAKAIAWKP